jgi:NAD(P)-dependent dehydrogenase (short-subunit alcohol dehydrogenase family)
MSEWTGVAGKQVLITGATNGIGLAASEALVRRGAKLAVVARDDDKGRRSVEQIERAANGAGPAADLLLADLSSQTQVRRLAAEVLDRYPRVDVLVNNAGAMFQRRRATEDGIELTWALNHLAPFLLTNLLLERLEQSVPARVITTASDAHRGAHHIPFDDVAAERSYTRGGFARYGETKLANILFTAELARRLQGSEVSAYCFHPGLVATGFNRNNSALMGAMMLLVKPFSRSPEHGARTLVWLADAAEPGPSGGYFTDEQVATPTSAGQDADAARRLWELSEEQTGMRGEAAA